MNKETLNQIFIDCAFYGYIEGLKAILQSGRKFTVATWNEAMRNAALGGNSDMVRFFMNQYVLQKREIVVDVDWLRMLDERMPMIARDIDLCDRYVRAEKMRAKLKEYGIEAPGVEIPEFIDRDSVLYDLVDEVQIEAEKKESSPPKGAVYAQSDQFGRSASRLRAPVSDAQAVESWLSNAKRSGA